MHHNLSYGSDDDIFKIHLVRTEELFCIQTCSFPKVFLSFSHVMFVLLLQVTTISIEQSQENRQVWELVVAYCYQFIFVIFWSNKTNKT